MTCQSKTYYIRAKIEDLIVIYNENIEEYGRLLFGEYLEKKAKEEKIRKP
jgi:hypothetical protein